MARIPSPRNSRTLRGLREDLSLLRGLVDRSGPGEIDPVDPTSERRERIDQYFARHDVRKVQLGAGMTTLPSWLSTDAQPRCEEVLAVDATRPLPFPDGSIDYFCAEHVIEHVRYGAAQRLLRHTLRALRPGGVLRIATPDLARLVALYRGDAGPEGKEFLRLASRRWLHGREDPVALLNHSMRAWGHRYLYDEDALTRSLRDAGYVDITRRCFGESEHAALRGVERHGSHTGIPKAIVEFETLVIEASKPR